MHVPDRRRALARTAIIAALVFLTTGGVALAQEVQQVVFRIEISHLSRNPGPVEQPDLFNRLRQDFRYESLRVITRRRLRLNLEEVGGVDLPTGRRIQISPVNLDSRGVLVFLEIEDGEQMDLRVPNRHPVVVGIERYKDGKLVLQVTPEY